MYLCIYVYMPLWILKCYVRNLKVASFPPWAPLPLLEASMTQTECRREGEENQIQSQKSSLSHKRVRGLALKGTSAQAPQSLAPPAASPRRSGHHDGRPELAEVRVRRAAATAAHASHCAVLLL